MVIAITGGAGFLGTHLLHALRGAYPQAELRVLTRRRELPADLAELGIRAFVADLGEPEAHRQLQEWVEGAEVVYHLAALYAEGEAHAARLEAVNVVGTRAVLRAAREAGVASFLHCSTMGTCAPRADGRPATEADEVAPAPPASPYVRTKILGERAALAEAGPRVIVANPAAPIGAFDREPSVTGRRLRAVLAGERPPLPPGEVAYASAEALARGLLLAATKGQPGRRYLLGGENLSGEAFLDRVAERAGVRVPRERWYKRFTRRSGAPANLAIDDSRARAELGYESGDLDRAIQEAIAWFRR